MSTDDRVTAVIVTEAIDEKGVSGDRLCRHIFALEEGAAERRPAWVFNTTPKGIPGMLGRLQGEQSVRMAVHDAFASPSSLLFVVNELLNQDAKDARKSERLLYSTAIRFRPAGRGRQTEDLGCCYNISEGGLYVRTLAPPEPWTELWLEFTPPRSDRIVHLEATAVWTRAYGPAGKATAPSGFGVQLVGGSAADVERYTLGCKALVEERAARLLSTRPPAV